jgi:hypothetical protein
MGGRESAGRRCRIEHMKKLIGNQWVAPKPLNGNELLLLVCRMCAKLWPWVT